MRIKMLEFYQGRGQPSLEIGKVYTQAELGPELTAWLLEHRKALPVDEPKPVLPKPAPKPEPKPEPQKEEEPAKTVQKPAGRARRGRGRTKT